jgi:hypothetical protein
MMAKGFLKIIEELDFPPIFLVHHKQFEMIEGEERRNDNKVTDLAVGLAAIYYPVFTIHPWLEGRERDNVIYHELAHHLWPYKPHWWIEIFAQKMARGGGKGFYSAKYKKTIRDLPPRAKLLQMARAQSARIKKRYYLRRPKKRSHPEVWTPPS